MLRISHCFATASKVNVRRKRCAAIESRKAAGLTQKQLAEKMGTAQANISRFENGNSNPSLEFLQKMAACMGKTLHVSFE